MRTNIKLFKNKTQFCAFNTDNFALYNLNEESYNLLSSINNGEDLQTILQKFEIEQDELNEILKSLNFSKNDEIFRPSLPLQFNKIIGRITLHVSNDCNLRCKYCYASGGSYGAARGLMKIETARRFVDYCCENYETVKHITSVS
jgi:uncharacterized protein